MHIMLFLTFRSQRLPAFPFVLFHPISRGKLGNDIRRAASLLIQSPTVKMATAIGKFRLEVPRDPTAACFEVPTDVSKDSPDSKPGVPSSERDGWARGQRTSDYSERYNLSQTAISSWPHEN